LPESRDVEANDRPPDQLAGNEVEAMTGQSGKRWVGRLLGNIAFRMGRAIRFDAKTETWLDDEDDNRLLVRSYRAPFVVSTQVWGTRFISNLDIARPFAMMRSAVTASPSLAIQ
jgi:hypothetical protein